MECDDREATNGTAVQHVGNDLGRSRSSMKAAVDVVAPNMPDRVPCRRMSSAQTSVVAGFKAASAPSPRRAGGAVGAGRGLSGGGGGGGGGGGWGRRGSWGEGAGGTGGECPGGGRGPRRGEEQGRGRQGPGGIPGWFLVFCRDHYIRRVPVGSD